EVRVEKARKADNAKDHPGVNERAEDMSPVAEMDLADVVHAALEHHVARAVAAGDSQIDQDFFELHSEIRFKFRAQAGLGLNISERAVSTLLPQRRQQARVHNRSCELCRPSLVAPYSLQLAAVSRPRLQPGVAPQAKPASGQSSL